MEIGDQLLDSFGQANQHCPLNKQIAEPGDRTGFDKFGDCSPGTLFRLASFSGQLAYAQSMLAAPNSSQQCRFPVILRLEFQELQACRPSSFLLRCRVEHHPAANRDDWRELPDDEAISRHQQHRRTQTQLREVFLSRLELLLSVEIDGGDRFGSKRVKMHPRSGFQRLCSSNKRKSNVNL